MNTNSGNKGVTFLNNSNGSPTRGDTSLPSIQNWPLTDDNKNTPQTHAQLKIYSKEEDCLEKSSEEESKKMSFMLPPSKSPRSERGQVAKAQ